MSAILSLLATPLGRWIAGGLAVLAVVGAAWLKGDAHGRAAVQARWDAAIAADARRVANANQQAAATYAQLEGDRDDADRRAADLADAFAAASALAGAPDAPAPATCDLPRPGDARRLLDIWRGQSF